MIALAIQLGVSLAAVLALGWLARQMGLGGDPRILNGAHAIRLAHEGIYGFDGVDAAIDRAGYSALVRDGNGRHVLIMKKGNKFVTRLVTPPIEGRLDQKLLTIELREPDCPPVTLNLGDKAQYWASGLRHIPVGQD
ncbi:MAG: hypothetical protein AABY88_07220 [Pseudomonadota bacterium]